MSFRRKPESSLFKLFWTPAFAGVTLWANVTFLTSIVLPFDPSMLLTCIRDKLAYRHIPGVVEMNWRLRNAPVLSGRNDELIRRRCWIPDTGFWIGEARRLRSVEYPVSSIWYPTSSETGTALMPCRTSGCSLHASEGRHCGDAPGRPDRVGRPDGFFAESSKRDAKTGPPLIPL